MTIAKAEAVLIGAVAVAVVLFAILSGVAQIVAQGPMQTCERTGGHWATHYDSTSPVPNAWIQDEECKR